MKTILIVEDEPILQDVLREILMDSGYRVLTAGSALLALAILEEERPDAIVLDVMLPGMDGRDAYREIRQIPELVSVPIIMMSAIIRPSQLDPGIAAFVSKPFNLDTILTTIEHAVREPPAGHQR